MAVTNKNNYQSESLLFTYVVFEVEPFLSEPPCTSPYSQSLVAFPKLKRQVLSYDPVVSSPKDFAEGTLFFVNQEFSLM